MTTYKPAHAYDSTCYDDVSVLVYSDSDTDA